MSPFPTPEFYEPHCTIQFTILSLHRVNNKNEGVQKQRSLAFNQLLLKLILFQFLSNGAEFLNISFKSDFLASFPAVNAKFMFKLCSNIHES